MIERSGSRFWTGRIERALQNRRTTRDYEETQYGN
jgi:hypothetical protein